jgi:hypothetical protein
MSLEKIGEALGIPFIPEEEKKETPIVKIEIEESKQLEVDFQQVRKNLKNLVSTGEEAIEGILKVAQEGDSPRAYEVAAAMIKTVSEVNKDIIEMHHKMKQIEKPTVVEKNTTNNSIYVGSTSDLQDLINTSRSRKKVLKDESTENG